MTRCDVEASGAVELYFYGELEGRERSSVEHHLTTCCGCRQALEQLSVIRDALARRRTVAAPPDGDWSGFMARLNRSITGAIRASPVLPSPSVARPAAVAPVRRVPARRQYVAYLAMAAILMLVTASVAYLARARGDVRLPVASTSEGSAGGTPVDGVRQTEWTPDAAFASLSEQHFERSKLVVLGLAHRDADAASDWAYERQLASMLLSDTRLYRVSAEQRGLQALARVMGDLELVLLQTSFSDRSDPETLEQIQRLIRTRDLVTKMDVVKTGL